MSLRLFDIVTQLKALERLEDSDEIPPEVIADTLEGLQGSFEVKAVAVAKFILSVEANADAIKEAAAAMKQRAERLQRRADSIKHYLLLQCQIVDVKKISTAEIIISRRANPVAVQVTDSATIPEQFWVQPPPPPKQLDKKAIKEALQNGTDVPGAFLESGEHIRISL